jgi:hypothetical protein
MHGLGELEAAVMDVLWHAEEPIKVRDVLEQLDTGKQLAYCNSKVGAPQTRIRSLSEYAATHRREVSAAINGAWH